MVGIGRMQHEEAKAAECGCRQFGQCSFFRVGKFCSFASLKIIEENDR